MPIRHGANEPNTFYVGNNAVSRIYRGSQQVWPASALATVTTQSSITHRGVTFTFDRPMPTCTTCLGEPAVISTESFAITSITPVSAGVSGPKGTFVANGAMLNPGDLHGANEQGFDGLLGEDDDGSGQSGTAIPYNASLNIDPAINGNIAFSAGATGSVVKSVRFSSVTQQLDGNWSTFDVFVVLSVLDAVPVDGFFRPPLCPGTKTVFGAELDVNYGILRTETNLAGIPDQAGAEAAIPETLLLSGFSNAQAWRRWMPEGIDNYSRDFGVDFADAHALLFVDVPNSEKRTTLLRSIQHGIDIAGATVNGFDNVGGAGQHYGLQFFSFVAAFGLNSDSLLTIAQNMGGGALKQHFWVTAGDTEQAVGFPDAGDNNRNEAPLLASDIGIPEWDRQPGDPTRRDASPWARYREMWPAGMIEAINIAMLQNGPGFRTGVEAILEDGPFNNTNPAAAALAYYDRQRPRPTSILNDQGGDSIVRYARFDAWRPLIGLALWTGRPDWTDGDGQLTPGNSSIAYDWSAHTWSTLPVTQRDIRYSLDGRQWIEQLDVSGSGTLSSLTNGLDHHVSFRIRNSAGIGRWSVTYPLTGGGSARNVVAPNGTPSAAAPVNTVAPLIMVREVENWGGSDMVSVGSTFTTTQRDNFVVLYAGVGYWTGFPAPTFSYEWRANGVPISGATSDSFDPKNRFDLSEAVITCVVTADDGTNQVSATTQSVMLPEVAPPAAYVDDFGAEDASARWYPTIDSNTNSAGSIAYNGATNRLDVTLGDGFSGAGTGPIPIVRNADMRLRLTFENTAGSSVDIKIGTVVTGASIDNLSNTTVGGSALQTYDTIINEDVDEIYVSIVRRGTNAGAVFHIDRLEVAYSTPDVTAPVLSSANGANVGDTDYSGSVTTNEADGTLYWLVNTSAATPSLATVKAANSQSVTLTGSQAVSGSGLTASTTYYIHYAHTDAAGNDSAVISSSSFTTAALPSIIYVSGTAYPEDNVFASSHTITLPGSITNGNRLVMVTVNGDEGDTTITPVGWTAVSSTPVQNQSTIHVFEKVASGDANASVTLTHTSNTAFMAYLYEFSGADGAVSFAAASETDDVPSVTLSGGPKEAVFIAGTVHERSTGQASAAPAGYAGLVNVETRTSASVTAEADMALAYRIANVTTEDPDSFTFSNTQTDTAFLIAIEAS